MTVYLSPHSTLRGHSLPRSDTLFGAICWGLRLLSGRERLEALLHDFSCGAAPFLISSLYEYIDCDDRRSHYLPKPLGNPYIPDSFDDHMPGIDELEALKRLESTRTICENDFSDILRVRKSDTHLYEACLTAIRGVPQAGRNFLASRSVSIPHTAVNRLTGASDPDHLFYTEERLFPGDIQRQRSGVFFCMKCREDVRQTLKAVIYFLADTGIGGGTSSGKGHFSSIEIVDGLPYHEPPAGESTHLTTLSLTYPDDGLKNVLSRSWYMLERRHGKIESMYAGSASGRLEKDSILMLCEGSTFPKNGQRYYGRNTIVRRAGNGLDFDVWHYGYAFTVNTQHVMLS